MKKIILNAKNWQLFLLTFGIPIVLLVLFSVTTFIRMSNNLPLDIDYSKSFSQVFSLFSLFSSLILYFWYRAVGLGLQKLMPAKVDLKPNRFKIALACLLIYSLASVAIFTYLVSGGGLSPWIMSTTWIFHLLALGAWCFCLYFVAKTICTVELQEEVRFPNCFRYMVLLLLFPIGVWWIQPKINRLARR